MNAKTKIFSDEQSIASIVTKKKLARISRESALAATKMIELIDYQNYTSPLALRNSIFYYIAQTITRKWLKTDMPPTPRR